MAGRSRLRETELVMKRIQKKIDSQAPPKALARALARLKKVRRDLEAAILGLEQPPSRGSRNPH